MSLNLRVVLLGIAQIVSWGTLFYAIGVLGEPMRDALGASEVTLFGGFSAGMVLSGVIAPRVGREIDARGGRGVLAAGSVLAAVAMAVLALAPNPVVLVIGWLLAGIASTAALYDAGFATLHQFAGTGFRRAITVLTLLGGFASTVFWPLSQWLLEVRGFRVAFAVHAVLNLAVCLPLHLVFVPSGMRVEVPPPAAGSETRTTARGTFAWLATAFGLTAFLASAVSAHLVALLGSGGLAASEEAEGCKECNER